MLGMMIKKTNAMRLLDSMGIPYSCTTYEVDEEHLDAIHAAQSAGLDPERVYKTIVMTGSSGQLYVFVTPALFDISLKKARALTGEKALELLPLSQLQAKTGYIRGGCSPLGMIHRYTTYVEELAQLEDQVYVSAGLRGVQLCLSPDDLVRAADASYASFT